MIKKKLLYILIITGILIGPIMYWMNAWWGVKFNKIPSIGVFRYVFIQDKFLLTVSAVNLSLYVIALLRIITLKGGNKSKNAKDGSDAKQAENSVSFLSNTNQSDIAKWENLYGNNAHNVNISNDKKVENENKSEPVTNTSEPMENTKNIEQNAPVQVTTQAQNISQPVNQNTNTVDEKDNVVSMPAVLTARDVYKNMIDDVLIDAGYVNMGTHTIANTDIDFVAIAESDTLVLGLISTESGEIIANEISGSNNETPSWFTNERKFSSPVWEVKNVANMVQNMINEVLPEDNGILIKPVVILPNAVVSNYADIKAKWEEIGVDVVRFMNHSDLPNLVDVLPDKSGTEVLESYKNFVNTLMKYFSKKAKKSPIKKVG